MAHRGGRNLAKAKAARLNQERVQARAPLGKGLRFQALERSIEASNKVPGRKKIEDPGALAAAIGRKRYGKVGFAKLSAAGGKRA